MEMGMSMAEYEASVGPKNKFFHEAAESVYLSKTDVLPLEREENGDPVGDPSQKEQKMHSSPSNPSSQY